MELNYAPVKIHSLIYIEAISSWEMKETVVPRKRKQTSASELSHTRPWPEWDSNQDREEHGDP